MHIAAGVHIWLSAGTGHHQSRLQSQLPQTSGHDGGGTEESQADLRLSYEPAGRQWQDRHPQKHAQGVR